MSVNSFDVSLRYRNFCQALVGTDHSRLSGGAKAPTMIAAITVKNTV
jgi:hypothetical protein